MWYAAVVLQFHLYNTTYLFTFSLISIASMMYLLPAQRVEQTETYLYY